MSELDQIKEPIASELKRFETYFRDVMKTRVPLLNLVINYLLRRKGKQMRPILVFLVARLVGRTQFIYLYSSRTHRNAAHSNPGA